MEAYCYPFLRRVWSITVFRGRSFGAVGEQVGEVVFNTGMTGYQEILTDPSYRGQMVVMTYPHIGNTGINDEDPESAQPHLRALIVRNACRRESNWRARQTLAQYLSEHEIMALTDIDTRALTRHLRQFGALRGVVSTVDLDPASLQRRRLPRPPPPTWTWWPRSPAPSPTSGPNRSPTSGMREMPSRTQNRNRNVHAVLFTWWPMTAASSATSCASWWPAAAG